MAKRNGGPAGHHGEARPRGQAPATGPGSGGGRPSTKPGKASGKRRWNAPPSGE